MAVLILALTASSALAHEKVVLPVKHEPATGRQTELLVVARPGAHFGPLAALIDFGDVRLGQWQERQLDLQSVSSESLRLSFVPPSPDVTVRDATTGGSLSSVTLSPGESRSLLLRYAPTSASPLVGTLEVHSFHDSLVIPVVNRVSLSGHGRRGPVLRVAAVGTGDPVIDFGQVSRRPYGVSSDDPRPSRDFVVSNVGDTTARAVEIRFPSVPLGGSGCDRASTVAWFCISLLDRTGVETGETAALGDLAPNATVTARMRIFPGESAFADRTYTIESVLDPTVAPVQLGILAEILPFFTGLEVAAGSNPLAAGPAAGDGGLGRNVDPFASDPLASFRPTGFDSRSVFDLQGLDAVDAQSGNLVLSIPIGGEQPASASGLGYALRAAYNSNVWSRQTRYDYTTGQGGDPSPRNGDPADRFPNSNAEYPNPIFNSSPGWSVHLGRLLPPVDWLEIYNSTWQQGEKIVDTGYFWTYVTPSGTQLRFWPDLNEPLPNYGASADALANAEYLYERSGSFMRLRKVSGTRRELELPNGEIHVFELLNGDGSIVTHPDKWVLTEMKDRFGHSIRVTYAGTSWSINDGHRVVRVDFVAVAGVHRYAVDRVVLPGFAGAADRIYDFVYTPAVTIDRPVSSTWHRANVSLEERRLTLQRLAKIRLPDGTAFAFTYFEESGDEQELLLSKVDLPTGASLNWEYEKVADTTPDCLAANDLQALRTNGVSRRWVTEPAGSGTVTLAETRYLRALRRAGSIPADYCEAIVQRGSFEPYTDQIVGIWRQEEASLSSVELKYFSKWPMQAEAKTGGWSRRERNVNSTRGETADGARLLGSQLYSCPFAVGAAPALDPLSDAAGDVWGRDARKVLNPAGGTACELLESRYAEWEIPLTYPCEEYAPECNIGARTLSAKRVFENDSRSWIAETNELYDGVGHFRKSTRTRSSQFQGGTSIVSYTGYDATNGNLTLNDDGTVATDVELPGPSWILDTYTTRWIRQDGQTMGGEAHFDASTGLLLAERTWQKTIAGTSDVTTPVASDRGAGDLVTLFEYASGELAAERHYGAETFVVPTGDTWWDPSLYPESKADFGLELAYEAGVLARRRVSGQSVFEVYRSIDPATGWVRSETRNSGEFVKLSYDSMGRVVDLDSDRLADAVYTYSAPTTTQTTWKIGVKTYETLADANRTRGSAALTRYEATLDSLGRVSEERVRHPDSGADGLVWSIQNTVYHPSGQIWRRSLLNDADQNLEVHYDVKGRPTTETLPGGERVVHQYTGDRIRNDFVWVNGNDGDTGAVRSQVRRTFDSQARVLSIEAGEQERTMELDGSISTRFLPIQATSFTYSPRGDLQSAKRGTQTRTTTHDGRGFLVFESIPEKTASTSVTSFDTRGQGLSVSEKVGSSSVRTKTFAFDALGRPTSFAVDGRTIQSWTYKPACAAASGDLATADLSACSGDNGQLANAVRVNLRTPQELGGGFGPFCVTGECDEAQFRVETHFRYDSAGRNTDRELFVKYQALKPTVGTSQTWLHQLTRQAYDDLGRVTSQSYPCALATTSPGANCAADRTVGHTWIDHLQRSVANPGFGASFTYNLDGSIATIRHDNGTVDTYTPDAAGRSRPASIELAKVGTTTAPWSRSYAYDPAGNLSRIGGDSFSYDANSRLVSGQVGTDLYRYVYDQYGNIANYGTIETATNHLSGGLTAYDPFGNYTRAGGGQHLLYDESDKSIAMYDTPNVTGCTGTCAGTFSIYDHEDLRILVYRTGSDPIWTVRGFNGSVQREYALVDFTTKQIVKAKDYVYAGTRLVSSETFGAAHPRRHYHLDHLGSARLVTGGQGAELLRLDYSPYGFELPFTTSERIGFTGHEKDGNGFTTYMKGRTFLGLRAPVSGGPANTFSESGRFLQVDPGRAGWNQYQYASASPLMRVDPTGNLDIAALSNNTSYELGVGATIVAVGVAIAFAPVTATVAAVSGVAVGVVGLVAAADEYLETSTGEGLGNRLAGPLFGGPSAGEEFEMDETLLRAEVNGELGGTGNEVTARARRIADLRTELKNRYRIAGEVMSDFTQLVESGAGDSAEATDLERTISGMLGRIGETERALALELASEEAHREKLRREAQAELGAMLARAAGSAE